MPVFSRVSSSMSLAASGSNWNAANRSMVGRGLSVRASSHASSTCRCSSGACSGPNEITTRSVDGLGSLTRSEPRSLGRLSASA